MPQRSKGRRDRMLKNIARKPISKMGTYLKYGFVIIEHEKHLCPRCKSVLNAGPNYQPKYCGQCGQRISFRGIKWREDRELGFAEGRDVCESFKN